MAYTAPRTWTTAELVTAALLNTHLRDNLSAGFPTDAVFDDWSPTYANLTIGNGTVVARYIQVAELVVAHFEFILGSTSAVGTGPTISTPVTSAAITAGLEPSVGTASLVDSGTASYEAAVRLKTTTTFEPRIGRSDGTYLVSNGLTATVPFTWTTNDIIAFTAAYEAA